MTIERSKSSDVERMMILMEEVQLLKMQVKPTATGHIRTAISVMNDRIEELQSKIENDLRKLQHG
tara:strand:- start:278 stop:472 length:195 start_codon:yes stop_codon:yes gene_type:complete